MLEVCATFDRELLAAVAIAFERSWRFVQHDAPLAHRHVSDLRTSLAKRIVALAKNGERDPLPLANRAIAQLRAESGTTLPPKRMVAA
jgi:hypothetical protein